MEYKKKREKKTKQKQKNKKQTQKEREKEKKNTSSWVLLVASLSATGKIAMLRVQGIYSLQKSAHQHRFTCSALNSHITYTTVCQRFY